LDPCKAKLSSKPQVPGTQRLPLTLQFLGHHNSYNYIQYTKILGKVRARQWCEQFFKKKKLGGTGRQRTHFYVKKSKKFTFLKKLRDEVSRIFKILAQFYKGKSSEYYAPNIFEISCLEVELRVFLRTDYIRKIAFLIF